MNATIGFNNVSFKNVTVKTSMMFYIRSLFVSNQILFMFLLLPLFKTSLQPRFSCLTKSLQQTHITFFLFFSSTEMIISGKRLLSLLFRFFWKLTKEFFFTASSVFYQFNPLCILPCSILVCLVLIFRINCRFLL